MKAQYFMSGEIGIILSEEEFSDLYEGPIRGKISMLDRENMPYAERDLEMVSFRNCGGALAKLDSFPEDAAFEKITKYKLSLSPDGFREIHERGSLAERLDGLGGRVDITLEGKV
ncbi:MAG TPA: hypothetical protein HA282_05305 [Nanoarchaeota archaeon]|nr:MAG: hypothetical protein QT01_C0001G0168 [archaeon GW2011_AR6]HIH17594.1 hypothetical protein [Nanoarchaeota archaeon]HIH33879.1 hypothetical protein [Nanoarchaeota archaeon]HIH51083.1 hypothetical protein [Nanoarchaeota archaeon]HIH66599.1 hypothetical protein [Nanoarchaeota archaeon]